MVEGDLRDLESICKEMSDLYGREKGRR